jgi:hypothetical protein
VQDRNRKLIVQITEVDRVERSATEAACGDLANADSAEKNGGKSEKKRV